jgi:hypothetical protein
LLTERSGEIGKAYSVGAKAPEFTDQPEKTEMKKLQKVLIAALLTIPVLTLNASSLSDDANSAQLSPTHSVTGWCYIYMAGRWWQIPC